MQQPLSDEEKIIAAAPELYEFAMFVLCDANTSPELTALAREILSKYDLAAA